MNNAPVTGAKANNKSCCIKEPPPLRVLVAYTCVSNSGNTDSYSPRFAASYRNFPAGVEHDLLIVCNGGDLIPARKKYFDGLTCDFFPRQNDGGFDISGYQDVAANYEYDLLVCVGESVYFWREGWLARMVTARLEFGPGMYGFFATHNVRAHLNTTAFAVDPHYLTSYPPVINNPQRYEFEHGENAMWRRIYVGGGAAVFVTWNHFLMPGHWRDITRGLNSADQGELMVKCNHTERFDNAPPATRAQWEQGANGRYR